MHLAKGAQGHPPGLDADLGDSWRSGVISSRQVSADEWVGAETGEPCDRGPAEVRGSVDPEWASALLVVSWVGSASDANRGGRSTSRVTYKRKQIKIVYTGHPSSNLVRPVETQSV